MFTAKHFVYKTEEEIGFAHSLLNITSKRAYYADYTFTLSTNLIWIFERKLLFINFY